MASRENIASSTTVSNVTAECPPLKVFITVDVELWPPSWDGYQRHFSDAFSRYILGKTPRGEVGLPFQLQMARDHGLRFVFFVESLFAREFGSAALAEIVHMIREADQDVQLHAHPEWVTHASAPLFETSGRFLFREFTRDEQTCLIEAALAELHDCGAGDVRAFRAGSFAANADTLAAVSRLGIDIDSSFKLGARVDSGHEIGLDGRVPVDGVREYPLSVFQQWPGRRRQLQLAACSLRELTYVLGSASCNGWDSVVVLSHSAELLNRDRSRPDRVVLRRFERFCRFLAERRNEFATSWFSEEDTSAAATSSTEPIKSARWRTGLRVIEQLTSRLSL